MGAATGDPPSTLTALIAAARLTWLNTVASSPLITNRVRTHLLRWGGIRIRDAVVGPHATFTSGSNVSIGAGSFIGPGVLFDAREHIEIGDSVIVEPDVGFVTSSHEIGSSSGRAGDGRAIYAPIIVEDGSRIGAGAVILAGVTIGRSCVIEAGALVNRDCAPMGQYGGVPARRKRDLSAAGGQPCEAGFRGLAGAKR